MDKEQIDKLVILMAQQLHTIIEASVSRAFSSNGTIYIERKFDNLDELDKLKLKGQASLMLQTVIIAASIG